MEKKIEASLKSRQILPVKAETQTRYTLHGRKGDLVASRASQGVSIGSQPGGLVIFKREERVPGLHREHV